jgi:hypothetical protein
LHLACGYGAILSEKGKLLVQLRAIGGGVAIDIEVESGWRTKEVILEDP